MTQNLKSLLKLAFKKTTKSTTKRRKIKSLFASKKTAAATASTKTTTTTITTSSKTNYLKRYNCKNKQIEDVSEYSCGSSCVSSDDAASNVIPFKVIPTQILIPPPVPMMLPQQQQSDSARLIEQKLTQATKARPANIPMLIIKSYKMNPTVNLQQINVGKGSAVNALYMLSNSWIFIKTFDDLEGYIPKYCCEPFATPTAPVENSNHTYISIMDTNDTTAVKMHEIQEIEDEIGDDITNLSLFSVSRCINFDSTMLSSVSTAAKARKTTMKSFSKKYYIKSTTTTTNRQAAYNLRRKSKLKQIVPNELTLTMLENHHKRQQVRKQQRAVALPTRQQPKRTTSLSSAGSSSNENYDLLMKCTSNNTNSAKNGRIMLYKVLCNYKADFKDDINVSKGDIVYSLNNQDMNNDWIFVKPYHKSNNDADIDCGGFIPRSYVLPL